MRLHDRARAGSLVKIACMTGLPRLFPLLFDDHKEDLVSRVWERQRNGKQKRSYIIIHREKGKEQGIRASLTVACDVPMLVFNDSEKRGPLNEVIKVEVDVIVFRQRVEVGEIGVEEVLGLKSAEGCHIDDDDDDDDDKEQDQSGCVPRLS